MQLLRLTSSNDSIKLLSFDAHSTNIVNLKSWKLEWHRTIIITKSKFISYIMHHTRTHTYILCIRIYLHNFIWNDKTIKGFTYDCIWEYNCLDANQFREINTRRKENWSMQTLRNYVMTSKHSAAPHTFVEAGGARHCAPLWQLRRFASRFFSLATSAWAATSFTAFFISFGSLLKS